MRKYREYTDDDIVKFSKEVYSISELLKKLNLKTSGGNFANIKKNLQKLNVDTSHWTGRAWNKGQQLKDWSKYTRINYLKKHLLKVKGHKCEECELTLWRNFPIVLEVHHLDGDRTNNNLDNLKLLCCNCHALTNNWRNKRSCGEMANTTDSNGLPFKELKE
jgi:hypothetical protein